MIKFDVLICVKVLCKGQLISEGKFDVLNFPKKKKKIWWISVHESRNYLVKLEKCTNYVK